MGHTNPELRPHLRPILDRVASPEVEPLEIDFMGRPLYFKEDVLDRKKGIQKAQKRAFDRKYRLALKHAATGKLKTLLEHVLRSPLPAGAFEVDRSSTGGMVEGDGEEQQNWARLMFIIKGVGSLNPGSSEVQAMNKVVKKLYSVPGECSSQVDDLGVYKGDLFLEITWWGAQWDDSMVQKYRDQIRKEEERVRREQELQKEQAEQAARMKDPAYVLKLIQEDLRSALTRLDTYNSSRVRVDIEGPKSLAGSYRSNLPQSYNSNDSWGEDDEDDWYDDELPDEGFYDEAVDRELSRADEVISSYLDEHKSFIKSIHMDVGDKDNIEVYVTLK